MAEQKEPRGDTGWTELARAGQPSCLTAGPQADLEWSLRTPEPLCQGPGCIWKSLLSTGRKGMYRKRLLWKAASEGKAADLSSERTAPTQL